MGWTAHTQRPAKPGTLWVGGGLGEGVLSPMTFLRRQPEMTGKKLLFPQTTSPDSDEHVDFPLSLPSAVPELQIADATSPFSHLANGCHLLHPQQPHSCEENQLRSHWEALARKTSFRYKERISFFPVLSKGSPDMKIFYIGSTGGQIILRLRRTEAGNTQSIK